MKKTLLILISVLMFTPISLMASGQGEENGSKEVILTYAIWDKNQEPVIQEIARAFESENPSIKIVVELTPYKQYFTKLETAVTGGSAPDVFWMNGPNSLKYIRGGALAPLSKDLDAVNYDLSVYPKGLIDLYSDGGELYGIPKDLDVTALWYNKAIFDAAGEPYPTDSWTWDDMAASAKRLNDPEAGISGMAFQFDSQVGIYNTIPQFGGYVISPDRKKSGYDDPGTIKGIQVWQDLIRDGVSPDAQTLTDNQVDDMFQSGKLAMTFAASWMVPAFMTNEAIMNDIDLTVMPMGDQRGAVIHGLSNSVYSDTKHPEAAKLFVQFLGKQEANDILAKSGAVIPAHTDSQKYYIGSYPEINLKGFTDQMDYTVMYPCSANTGKWYNVEQDYLKRVWALDISAEEAGKAIAKEMNRFLSEE